MKDQKAFGGANQSSREKQSRSESEAILDRLEEQIGQNYLIAKWEDEKEGNTFNIVTAKDVPENGLSTHSTINLSECTIDRWSDGVPLRAELLLTLPTSFERAAILLCGCAFGVMRGRSHTVLGAIMDNFAEDCLENSPLKHVMLIDPYRWSFGLVELPDKKVGWLEAILIMDAERDYAREHGSEALLALMDETDLADLERASVVP